MRSRDEDLSRLGELLEGRLHAQACGRDAPLDEIEALIQDIVDSAQRMYPAFDLPLDVFFTYLVDRLPTDVSWPLALRRTYTSDLYLACACARGDVHAFAEFDERCLRNLDRVLGKMGIDAYVSAEIKQDIRRRVLVGDDGRPEIVDFLGRGDLRGWVRVMAVRRALRRAARARREVPMDDELMQRLTACGDLELVHLKESYRQEFKRAFESALRALPDRTRTLLRQHYVDGSSIDELARLYRVHRSTAARLLARARVLVLEATRVRMKSQLQVQSQDLDSILRMIRSQIEISLRALGHRRKRTSSWPAP